MAEKYKSVLEKYNEDKKPRLPTAEEEAIEPVYPEEYLIGGPGGKMATTALKSSAEKAAAKAASRENLSRVKIGSRVRDYEGDRALVEKYASKPTAESIQSTKNKVEQAAKERNAGEILDGVAKSTYRGVKNLYGDVGNIIGSQMYKQANEPMQELAPKDYQKPEGMLLKKGGLTASHRGDGIASRGKTKGRFV